MCAVRVFISLAHLSIGQQQIQGNKNRPGHKKVGVWGLICVFDWFLVVCVRVCILAVRVCKYTYNMRVCARDFVHLLSAYFF